MDALLSWMMKPEALPVNKTTVHQTSGSCLRGNSFPQHAAANAGFVPKVDDALLRHAGRNGCLNSVTTARLEHRFLDH
jgi:hypothetical protein